MDKKEHLKVVLSEKGKEVIARKKIVFNKAKIALKLYRKAVWHIEERIAVTETEYSDFGSYKLNEILELDELVSNTNKKRLEEEVCTIFKSSCLIEKIDDGLAKLKRYPKIGEELFEILYYSFINEEEYSDNEILEMLHYNKTTFYKKRRKAVQILGKAIWGIDIPDTLIES